MAITSAVDIDNLDHDPALAVALGNLVVTWARAEGEMVRAFAAVCGISVNHAHFGYYRIPTFEARTKVIRSLLGEWKTTKYHPGAIADAISNLSRLSKARNDWVHGIWSKEEHGTATVIFDFRAPEGKGRMKPVKAADVKNHLDAVRTRTGELRALLPDVRHHDDDP